MHAYDQTIHTSILCTHSSDLSNLSSQKIQVHYAHIRQPLRRCSLCVRHTLSYVLLDTCEWIRMAVRESIGDLYIVYVAPEYGRFIYRVQVSEKCPSSNEFPTFNQTSFQHSKTLNYHLIPIITSSHLCRLKT